MSWYVTITWNTHPDGTWVEETTTEEDWPRCHYGPFVDQGAATHWMEDVYPDGDTDVEDMWAHEADPATLGYVNPPETVVASSGSPIATWTQGRQP